MSEQFPTAMWVPVGEGKPVPQPCEVSFVPTMPGSPSMREGAAAVLKWEHVL